MASVIEARRRTAWRSVHFGRIGGVVLGLAATAAFMSTAYSQSAVDQLKSKIFDAKMAEQSFAGGLRHCKELDGGHFYLEQRDRVIDLVEYHRSLDNLASAHSFNPETRRPWSQQDAYQRWEQVKQEAHQDQVRCQLVTELPELQKKLDALQPPAVSEKTK